MRNIKMIILLPLSFIVFGCQEDSEQMAPTNASADPSENSESQNQTTASFDILSSMAEVGSGSVIYGTTSSIAVNSSGTQISLLVDGIDNSIVQVNSKSGDRTERISNLASQSLAVSESNSEYILFKFSRWTGNRYYCPKYEADTDSLIAVSAENELTSRYISRDYQTWTCFDNKSPQPNTFKNGEGPIFTHEKDVDIEVSEDDSKALVIQETSLTLVDLESGDRFAVAIQDSLNGAQFVNGGVDWNSKSGIILDNKNRLYRLDFSTAPELTLINETILPVASTSDRWVAIEFHPVREQYLFLSEGGTLLISNDSTRTIIQLKISLEARLSDNSIISSVNLLGDMDLAEVADKLFISSYSSKSVFSFDLATNELNLVTYQINGE